MQDKYPAKIHFKSQMKATISLVLLSVRLIFCFGTRFDVTIFEKYKPNVTWIFKVS